MSIANTNYTSLIAQNNFNINSDRLTTSIKRLSSGLRINSAADDPAGLSIAQRMLSQINGLDQAARNANYGSSLAATAESALGQQASLLNQMRTLAVQAGNASNSSSDRTSIQSEMNQLKTQFDQIATQTSYNGVQLLNGAYTNQSFQIGAFAGQTTTLNVSSSRSTAVGNFALTANSNVANNGLGSVLVGATAQTFSGVGVAAQNVTVNGSAVGVASIAANSSALTIATAINLNTATTGVTATATNSVTISGISNVGTVNFEMSDSNGFTIQNVSASISNTGDLTALMDAVNSSSATTGLTAQLSAGSTAQLVITAADGGNILLGNYTNSGNVLGSLVTLTGLGGNSTTLMSAAGNDSATIVGTIALSSSTAYSVSSNVPNGAGGIFSQSTVAAGNQAALGVLNSVASVDVSTVTGAQTALSTIDNALEKINSQRAALGASVSRFQSSSANSTNTAINMSAARSTIEDVDYASEIATFTKTQLLTQMANSMMIQANGLPSGILQLLQKLS